MNFKVWSAGSGRWRYVAGMGLLLFGLLLVRFWSWTSGAEVLGAWEWTPPGGQAELGASKGSHGLLLDPVRESLQEANTPGGTALSGVDDAAQKASVDLSNRLVERLERLAEQADSFHRKALPVVHELGQLCASVEGLGEAMLEELVVDELRSPLVRGAVFLALAKSLGQADFNRVFEPWIRNRQLPRELLRTAALAASERGQPSGCQGVIDLSVLERFPVLDEFVFPGVYPLLLHKVVGPHVATALRGALADFDPVLDGMEATLALPTNEPAARQAADSILAREILLLVLGQRSLVDSELEAFVLSLARFEHRKDGHPTVDFRSAMIVVHALSNCSDRYLDFVAEAARAKDPRGAGLYRMMQGAAVGPLNLGQLGKLMDLRWSEELGSQALLGLELTELGKRLGLEREMDVAHRAEFLDFMRQLTEDPDEAEEVRQAALMALQEGHGGELAIEAAASLFGVGASVTLRALALGTMAEVAHRNPGLRVRVLEMLQEILVGNPEAWVRSDVMLYIEELK